MEKGKNKNCSYRITGMGRPKKTTQLEGRVGDRRGGGAQPADRFFPGVPILTRPTSGAELGDEGFLLWGKKNRNCVRMRNVRGGQTVIEKLVKWNRRGRKKKCEVAYTHFS